MPRAASLLHEELPRLSIDHGPKTEIIDLSGRAAEEIDMIKDGRAQVKLEVVGSTKKSS